MGNFFSSLGDQIVELYRNNIWFITPKNSKILILGLDDAGKTTLLRKIKLGEDDPETVPTLGFNVESLNIGNVNLTCWDIGGSIRLRHLWSYHFRFTDGIIFVIDGSNHSRLNEAWEALKDVLIDDEVIPLDVTVVICLNKSDANNHVNSITFIEKYKLYEYFKKRKRNRKWYVIDTCARSGEGVFEGFRLLSSSVSDKPEVKLYHSGKYLLIRKIQSLGWKASIHLLFPKEFRMYVWSLILVNDRKRLPIDVVKVILSYIPVENKDFEELKIISNHFFENLERYKKLSFLESIFTEKIK